ncbi:MAG: nicotinamide mononucleotide deamidase-related protein [Sulfolobales archaeon]
MGGGNYTAWIFTIGNEVVHGRVINTNSAFLGRRLVLLGYDVLGNISLVDDVDLISQFIKYVLPTSKVIITTGGLGPTYDDRTSEALAKALGLPLDLNQEAFEMVKSKYAALNLPLTQERVKMAMLPKGAKPIPNRVGTAPGIHVDVDDRMVISLPGVPKEMEVMFEEYVVPLLMARGPKIFLAEREFEVRNLPESSAAESVNKLLKKYSNVYIKTQPKGTELGKPILLVYVCVSSKLKEEAEGIADEVVRELMSSFISRGGVITSG